VNHTFEIRPLSNVPSAVIQQTLIVIERQRRSIGGRKAAATRRRNTHIREGVAKLVARTAMPESDKGRGKREQRARRAVAASRNGWQF